ncbi:MAG: hypothetical protein ACN6OC_12910 [Alcaligenes sp.]
MRIFLEKVMMDTRALGQTGARILQRQDLAPGPLGAVGNLRFSPLEGGTPGIGPSTPASAGRPSVGFSFRPQPVQEPRKFLTQARENSNRIGNVLGLLTATAGHGSALAKLGPELAQLVRLVRCNLNSLSGGSESGNLSSLAGGVESLTCYMNEMTPEDIDALRNGVLSKPRICHALLSLMPSYLRPQATKILEQITEALDQRRARDGVTMPLQQIQILMRSWPMNGPALASQLNRLADVLGMPDADQQASEPPLVPMLDTYLRSLPEYRLRELMFLFHADRYQPARDALRQLGEDSGRQRALAMLDCIHHSLPSVIHARVQPLLRDIEVALEQARLAGDQLAASQALCELYSLVKEGLRTYGWLPETVNIDVRRLVQGNLDLLFPDAVYNPFDPLNAAYLGRLDETVAANLRCVERLRDYELILQEENDRKVKKTWFFRGKSS